MSGIRVCAGWQCILYRSGENLSGNNAVAVCHLYERKLLCMVLRNVCEFLEYVECIQRAIVTGILWPFICRKFAIDVVCELLRYNQ